MVFGLGSLASAFGPRPALLGGGAAMLAMPRSAQAEPCIQTTGLVFQVGLARLTEADPVKRRVHFTPANLVTNLHRSLEHGQTRRALSDGSKSGPRITDRPPSWIAVREYRC